MLVAWRADVHGNADTDDRPLEPIRLGLPALRVHTEALDPVGAAVP